jgi:hypothetical protein
MSFFGVAVLGCLSILAAEVLFVLFVRGRWGWRRWYYRHVYLRGRHWQDFRRQWWRSHPGAVCSRCGRSGAMDLHHLTYERIGRERQDDVVPVHRMCHRLVESGR